jgi:hypothetical protein
MSYLARDGQLDNFLVEVGGSCVVPLVFVVERDGVVLVHGCFLLTALGVRPHLRPGQRHREVGVELEGGLLLLGQPA